MSRYPTTMELWEPDEVTVGALRRAGASRRPSHSPFRRRVALLGAALAVATGTVTSLGLPSTASRSAPATPAAAATASTVQQVEEVLAAMLHATRTDLGRSALTSSPALVAQARAWSASMQRAGSLSHDPQLAVQVGGALPNWRSAGENVGYGADAAELHRAFLEAPGHRANLLGDFNQIGIGVATDADGGFWVTYRFAKIVEPAGGRVTPVELPDTTPPAVPIAVGKPPTGAGDGSDTVGIRRVDSWHLRYSNTGGDADWSFSFGAADADVFVGDWDGDGDDTVGVRDGTTFHFRNSNTPGPPDLSIRYGRAEDEVVVGDWDGDGKDTIGVRRANQYHLRNRLSSGPADKLLVFGRPGDDTFVGDWDGDGEDTLAVRRGTLFYIKNNLASGIAERVFSYGAASDDVVVGDWDGDGDDSVGVHRDRWFHLRDSLTSGPADNSFIYGRTGDRFFVGDW